MFGGNQATPRQALAFSLSLVLHLGLAALILSRLHRRMAEPPIEISISGGSSGAAPALAGGEGSGAGPMRPAPQAAPVEKRRPLSPRRTWPRERSRSAAPRPPSSRGFGDVEASIGVQEALPPGPAADRGPTAAAQPAVPSGGGGGAPAGTGGAGFSVSGTGAGGAGRSYASIWQWTRRYLSALRSVYEGELRSHPELRGVMVVRYEILASGAVGEVELISTELAAHRLERSVLGQIREWRYPPEPSGSVLVTWPLRFEPPS